MVLIHQADFPDKISVLTTPLVETMDLSRDRLSPGVGVALCSDITNGMGRHHNTMMNNHLRF